MLIAGSITQVTSAISTACQAADAAAILHTIIDAAPKPTKPQSHSELGYDDGTIAGGDIVLQNVNFTYATRPELKVLDDLTLCFPAGKTTAIVGPSGSGKSTIVAILQRWYEFNGHPETNQLVSNGHSCTRSANRSLTHQVYWLRNGLVSISGQELRSIDVKWWRNQIGFVQQDSTLFTTTIYENIEFGLIGTEWEHGDKATKDRMIREACVEAFADEFISRLPQV